MSYVLSREFVSLLKEPINNINKCFSELVAEQKITRTLPKSVAEIDGLESIAERCSSFDALIMSQREDFMAIHGSDMPFEKDSSDRDIVGLVQPRQVSFP
jgi:hypothetical protein